ncbi:MAG: hypothetical protein LBO69_07760 [Ignavibacteria bacterium]|nr:hypothetical protein [Ignavibacteria bacterium]
MIYLIDLICLIEKNNIDLYICAYNSDGYDTLLYYCDCNDGIGGGSGRRFVLLMAI